MMMMMDRRRRMMEDADGGGRVLVHRERRTRWLAVVVAVQNVLMTLSLAVTLYVYLDVNKSLTARADKTSEDYVHIRFHTISDISGNGTLQFSEVHSNNTMHLADGKKDQIYVNCNGPYVLYMYLCYKGGLKEEVASGILQLLVSKRETPVSSFTLNASDEVCRGLHSTAYLRAKEMVSLRLSSSDGFKIKTATVGLSYMLGSQCDY